METHRSHWKTVLPLLFLSLFYTVRSSSSSHHHRRASSTIRFRLPRAGSETVAAAASERQIPMRAGAPFKIALFADLHFGEDAWTDWGPVQDVNSIRVMNTVLDDETPVCTGIRQSPQHKKGAYLGPVYLETMMMLHLSGH